MNIGDVVFDSNQGYGVIQPDGSVNILGHDTSSVTIAASNVLSNHAIGATTTLTVNDDDLLDEFEMNRFAVDHKVTDAELLKLKEVAPDYASEIKDNIARNLARDITKKIAFKKKHDTDTDVHHFIGRVWVFTDEEMKEIVRRIK